MCRSFPVSGSSTKDNAALLLHQHRTSAAPTLHALSISHLPPLTPRHWAHSNPPKSRQCSFPTYRRNRAFELQLLQPLLYHFRGYPNSGCSNPTNRARQKRGHVLLLRWQHIREVALGGLVGYEEQGGGGSYANQVTHHPGIQPLASYALEQGPYVAAFHPDGLEACLDCVDWVERCTVCRRAQRRV